MQPTSNQNQLVTRQERFQILPGQDPFEVFSDEVFLKIFSYFDPHTLCYAARVCKRWNILTNDKTLLVSWRKWAEHVTVPSSFTSFLSPLAQTLISKPITKETSIADLKKIACIGYEKEIKTMDQLINKIDQFLKKTTPPQNAYFECHFEQLKVLNICVTNKRNDKDVFDVKDRFYSNSALQDHEKCDLLEEPELRARCGGRITYQWNKIVLERESHTHLIISWIPLDRQTAQKTTFAIRLQRSIENRIITAIERLSGMPNSNSYCRLS